MKDPRKRRRGLSDTCHREPVGAAETALGAGTHLESNAPPGPSYSLESQPVVLDSHCLSVLLIAPGR
jgi:hypothetical protein